MLANLANRPSYLLNHLGPSQAVDRPPSYPLLLPPPLWPPVFEYLPWLARCFGAVAGVGAAVGVAAVGFACVVFDSFVGVDVGDRDAVVDGVLGVAGVPVFGSFVVVGGGPSLCGYLLWYVWTAVHGLFALAPF